MKFDFFSVFAFLGVKCRDVGVILNAIQIGFFDDDWAGDLVHYGNFAGLFQIQVGMIVLKV